MKKISDNTQGGELLARKLRSGEVGILLAKSKKADVSLPSRSRIAIYWDSVDDAIVDLEAIITYFRKT